MNEHTQLNVVQDSLAAARDSLTEVHMSTPADTIIRHGRVRRWRRGLGGLAATAAVAVGATLAITGLASPASHPSGPAGGAQLTAWTVTRQADGNVHVTVRQLRDPARLQARLRADGVPASVTYLQHPNPACHPYEHVAPPPGLAGRQHVPFRVAARLMSRVTHGVVRLEPGGRGLGATDHFVIIPAALPHGTGLQIGARVSPAMIGLRFGLVHVSQPCTGG
ncbi:MAG: hypothetical protein ACRDPO_37405 [Streptosporangiaceae bacterium]